jgi:histone H3/H4
MENFGIETGAAKALAEWKCLFGMEVYRNAKQLAAHAGRPASVTLADFKNAAKIALESLSYAIDGEEAFHGRPRAA